MGKGLCIFFRMWQNFTQIKLELSKTDDPEKYIKKVKSKSMRHSLIYNAENFGSPIAIASHSFKMSFKALENAKKKFIKDNKKFPKKKSGMMINLRKKIGLIFSDHLSYCLLRINSKHFFRPSLPFYSLQNILFLLAVRRGW